MPAEVDETLSTVLTDAGVAVSRPNNASGILELDVGHQYSPGGATQDDVLA